MKNLASELVYRAFYEAKPGQALTISSPLGTRQYTISAASCRAIVQVYSQFSEDDREKLIKRYAENPAGLAVFCSRLFESFGPPADWNPVFQTTFQDCAPQLSN